MHQPDLEKHSPLRLSFGAVRAFPWMFVPYILLAILLAILLDQLYLYGVLSVGLSLVPRAFLEASLIVPASVWLLRRHVESVTGAHFLRTAPRVALWWAAFSYLPLVVPAIVSIILIPGDIVPAPGPIFRGALIAAVLVLIGSAFALLGTTLPEVVHRGRGSLTAAFHRGKKQLGPTVWALIRYPALISTLSFALLFVLTERGTDLCIYDPSGGVDWAALPLSLLFAAIGGIETLTIAAILCRAYARTAAL